MIVNKKAFSDVIAIVFLFAAFIVLSSAVIVSFSNFIIDSQEGLDELRDFNEARVQTEITFTNLSFNSTSNEVIAFIENEGTSELIITEFTYFVDANFSPNVSAVLSTNLSRTLYSLTPGQIMVVRPAFNLTTGNYTFKAVSGYGISYSQTLLVP